MVTWSCLVSTLDYIRNLFLPPLCVNSLPALWAWVASAILLDLKVKDQGSPPPSFGCFIFLNLPPCSQAKVIMKVLGWHFFSHLKVSTVLHISVFSAENVGIVLFQKDPFAQLFSSTKVIHPFERHRFREQMLCHTWIYLNMC